MEPAFAPDPFAPLSLLPVAEAVAVDDPPQLAPAKRSNAAAAEAEAEADRMPDPREVIPLALCVEVRLGRLHVFLPPLDRIADARH